MRKAISAALCLAALLMSRAAGAVEVEDIFGRWMEYLPNGRGVMTEFTPADVITSQVDVFGIPTASTRQPVAGYRKLEGFIAVDLAGGAGLSIYESGRHHILLVHPGLPAHRLMRVQQQ